MIRLPAILKQAIATLLLFAPVLAAAQAGDRTTALDAIPLPTPSTCFGLRTIVEPEALAVCAALNTSQNLRARDLAENWLRAQPNSAGANYALAEVLLSVEGNVPRALFHLNRAEANSTVTSLDEMLARDADDASSPMWHYLTLNQLSSVHQLVGNQEESLRYLDALSEAYGVDLEPYKGWPLIKLKRFDLARQSALRVLNGEDTDAFSIAQAWNTLCAVELSEPLQSPGAPACDQALSLDEAGLNRGETLSTVTLSNAAEVALSRIRLAEAETLIDRATRTPNPSSVANPWIQKVYLTLAASRFDAAQQALTQMLAWRSRQAPLVSVSNRAEHYLVGATLLLLAGYTEDAARLAETALNQPDRNGNFSADDAQKEAVSALITALAYRADYALQRERAAAHEGWAQVSGVATAQAARLKAWQASRRAASLFAETTTLRDRLRPYGPLDVHIPEWMEPEIVGLLGAGVFVTLIDEAERAGAFQAGPGYAHSFRVEAAALNRDSRLVIDEATLALQTLPASERLLRARVQWHSAQAHWQSGDRATAIRHFAASLRQDPSLARRLGAAVPVSVSTDGSEQAQVLADKLVASPRFSAADGGLTLEVLSDGACLLDDSEQPLSCYTAAPLETRDAIASDALSESGLTAVAFQQQLFGIGIELSKAQRSALTGASVVLRAESYGAQQRLPDF